MKRFLIFSGLLFLLHKMAMAQSYVYDSNGNLSRDDNKKIASVHYNYLNLIDTVIYQDGRKIIYGYSNTGQKLQEQTIAADATIITKRDYIDEYNYVNDTLKTIQHGDARFIVQNSSAEYQYALKDHLGNVRALLTSIPDTDHASGTFETSNLNSEQSDFLHMENARRVNSVLFDHTKTGVTHYAQRLNGSENEKYGLARSMSVMPGDTVRLEVFAKYVEANPKKGDLTPALVNLLSQIANPAAGLTVDGMKYVANGNIPFPFAGMNNTLENTEAGPKAYLNWLMFDRNFVLKTGGYKKLSTAANEKGSNVPHEKLECEIIITSPGYVYTYLSNEQPNTADVYFDDFTVTQIKGPVVQTSEYDPMGLITEEQNRENIVSNNYLFSSKEFQTDFDLNWNDFGARMYDAAVGRWHVIDPKGEKYINWSPYIYAKNNPVKFVDPDGKEVNIFYKENAVQRWVSFDGSAASRSKLPDNAFVKAVVAAYDYNVSNGANVGNGGGKSTKEAVENHKYTVSIKESKNGDDRFESDQNTVYWDPNAGLLTNNQIIISPATALDHEFAHVSHFNKALFSGKLQEYYDELAKDSEADDKKVISNEEQATAFANGELKPGEVTRTDHGGDDIDVLDPTSVLPRNVYGTPKTLEEIFIDVFPTDALRLFRKD